MGHCSLANINYDNNNNNNNIPEGETDCHPNKLSVRERNSDGSIVFDSDDIVNLSAHSNLIIDSSLSISSYDLPTDANKLNIISFNVAGLISKLDDTDFVQFLENFDIVCLLETFMITNTLPKTMFNSFLPAFFIQRQNQQAREETQVELSFLLN